MLSIVKWLNRKKDTNIPRARVLKLKEGNVELHGFSAEVSEALAKHIKAFGQPTIVVPVGSDVLDSVDVPVTPSSDPLTEPAVGVRKNTITNKYDVVTVLYNPLTKEAIVDKVEPCDSRVEASRKFKMAADSHRFI